MLHYDKKHDPRYDDFIIKAMNRMKYDAVTLGQIELERGDAAVRDIVKQLSSKVVVSNVQPTAGNPPWHETLVITRAGHRVGLIGLVSRDFGGGADVIEKAGFKVEDPFAAVRRLTPTLRAKSDLIVVLAHMAHTEVDQLVKSEAVGVDLVVAGYNPYVMTNQPDTAVTTILRPGQRGEYIGVAHLGPVDKATGRAQAKVEAIMIEVAKLPEDPALADELTKLKAQIASDQRKKQLERELQVSEGVVLGQDRFLGNETCARCHGVDIAWWEKDPHAHAFATLEKQGKQNDASCLPCHVTGHGIAGGFGAAGTTTDMRNVQCESCHGMGTLHDWTGASTPVSEGTCKTCHVPEWSPQWNFTEYMAKLGHGTAKPMGQVKSGN